MTVPTGAMPVLSMFRPALSTPTAHRFLVRALAAVLTTGQHTVRARAPGPVASSPRGFSQRRWSAWALARVLITCLLGHLVPSGPVFLAGDETVTEHPGPHVCGQGRHRAGVRATPSSTASRWGHKWVVVSVLVTWPFATRPWALPVLAALSRPPAWKRVHRRRHQTPAHLARLLLARLMRWFPHRHGIVVGETGYGPSETARCCRQHRRHRPLVSQFDGDAALYEPPPPRTHTTRGRPRVTGRNLAAPREVVAPTTQRTRLTVAWYGGARRDLAIVTGPGPWYRRGEARVAGRWGYVHDGTSTQRAEYWCTTDRQMTPHQIVECATHRWSIATTSQEGREDLQLASTQWSGTHAVFRFTPC